MKNGIMCLNGKRIVFKGVNRHEFSCDRGRAIGREEALQDVITMKQNNINAVRTSHYPNGSALYRICDEYGIYMIAENNMEAHGSWPCMRAAFRTGRKSCPATILNGRTCCWTGSRAVIRGTRTIRPS